MTTGIIKIGGSEYVSDEVPGLESHLDLFLFSNGKYSVSNKIVGQLFLCLSFVGLVATSLNRFF